MPVGSPCVSRSILPPAGSGVFLGDARELQRARVRHGDVPVHAHEHRRVVARNSVDVLPRREFLAGPLGVVPAAPLNPLTQGRGRCLHRNTMFHLVERFYTDQIDIQFFEAAASQVQMRVVKSGHDEVPTKIDDLRVLPFQPFDIGV